MSTIFNAFSAFAKGFCSPHVWEAVGAVSAIGLYTLAMLFTVVFVVHKTQSFLK